MSGLIVSKYITMVVGKYTSKEIYMTPEKNQKKETAKQYVDVIVRFGSAGSITPTAINWPDGRTFIVSRVVDYFLAERDNIDRYIVDINGTTTRLFFERGPGPYDRLLGKWYVIKKQT